jgi:beta-lactam-binding protein with PASTA domain
VDPIGTVLGQSPPAGFRVNPGTTITLKVAQ